MSEERVAFDFMEMRFKKSDLDKVPEEFAFFILASCVAANDLAVFQRLMILTAMEDSEEKAITLIAKAQHSVVIRNLISKIVEFIKIFSDFCTKIGRSRKFKTAVNLTPIEDLLSELRDRSEYKTAANIRSNMTNHYIGSELLKSAAQFPDHHEFIGLIHNNNGNTSYVFGEEIGYFGALRSSNDAPIESDQLISWSLEASSRLIRTQQHLLSDIFRAFLPSTVYTAMQVQAESRFVSNFDEEMPLLGNPNYKPNS